jgi:hypothetical protein
MMDAHPSDARLLLALDGELDAPDTAAVADHVRACPACRATWDRLAMLSGDIERYCRTSHVDRIAAGGSAPFDAISQRRVREPARATPWQRSWRPRILSQSAALAAAAALVLIAGGAWLLWPRTGGHAPAPAPAVAIAAPRANDIALLTPAAAIGVVPPPLPPPQAPAPPRRHAIAAAATKPAPRKPTYYWSLPYSNGALPLSEGSVVMTVRLSRDQLRLAGIPVTEPHVSADRQREQSLVRAKVLVGADGLPRAIAFDQD